MKKERKATIKLCIKILLWTVGICAFLVGAFLLLCVWLGKHPDVYSPELIGMLS